MMRNPKILAVVGSIWGLFALNDPATSLDFGIHPIHHVDQDKLWALYESEYAILRMQRGQARPVGMAYVIHQNPLLLLTCYHLVSEGNELNNGDIVYLIARATHDVKEFDFRKRPAHTLPINRLIFKPEYDLAILEIDPAQNPEIASMLRLASAKPLDLDFQDMGQRAPGTAVAWLTTASENVDRKPGFVPRFFTANIVSNYVIDHSYRFTSPSGNSSTLTMNGVNMFELDKVLMPGASGGPILNAITNKVIGYAHGLHHFQTGMNTEVQLAFGLVKISTPVTDALSLGIDIRNAERYLKERGYVPR